MAVWRFESKAGAAAAQVDAEKNAALQSLLRGGGEGRSANEVYNLSPAELRSAVDADGVLDRDDLVNRLAGLTGSSDDEVTTEPDSALFDRVWDNEVKRNYWHLTGGEAKDAGYTGDNVSVEDFIRHREAELWSANRRLVEEQLGETDPTTGGEYDPSELSDEELSEKLADATTRSLLGGEDIPLSLETIAEHRKGDFRAELNELGMGPDETRGMSLSELANELEGRLAAGADGKMTGESAPTSPSVEDLPASSQSPIVRDAVVESTGPVGGARDAVAEATGSTGGLAGGGGAAGGEVAGNRTDSTPTSGGESEPTGPPAGSAHYGSALRDDAGNLIGWEDGYVDANGDWYNSDGSKMSAEKAERMEAAREAQDDEVATPVTDDTSAGDGAADEDVEFTPDEDRPSPDDIERYRAHLPDQGVAPTRNEGATDPADAWFDGGTAGDGELGKRDTPSDPPDEGAAPPTTEDLEQPIVGPDSTNTDPPPADDVRAEVGPQESPADIDLSIGGAFQPGLAEQVLGTGDDGDGSEPPLEMLRADPLEDTSPEGGSSVAGFEQAILPDSALQPGAQSPLPESSPAESRDALASEPTTFEPVAAHPAQTRDASDPDGEASDLLFGRGTESEPTTTGGREALVAEPTSHEPVLSEAPPVRQSNDVDSELSFGSGADELSSERDPALDPAGLRPTRFDQEIGDSASDLVDTASDPVSPDARAVESTEYDFEEDPLMREADEGWSLADDFDLEPEPPVRGGVTPLIDLPDE